MSDVIKRVYNLKPDKPDIRDRIYKAPAGADVSIKIDLRPKMSPIVDQGELGSCTANAIVSGLREYEMIKNGFPLIPLSRMFLYWHERDMEGTINEDSGAYIRDGMKALTEIGVCPEQDFPYDITKFTDKPSDQAEADASAYKIDSYYRITTLDDMKHALSLEKPVVIGITVYESFESANVAFSGYVPMPNKTTEKVLGGHALLVVGYDDTISFGGQTGYVIVRNSWGTGWGDAGYCYIPYAFISDSTLTSDMWIGEYNHTNPTPVPPQPTTEPWNGLVTRDVIKYYSGVKFKNGEYVIDSPDFWYNLLDKFDNAPETLTADDFRYVTLLLRKILAFQQGA